MKHLRASIAAVLTLSLVLVSPGGTAWAAMGKTMVPVAPRANVPVVPAGAMNLRLGAASLTPMPLSLTASGVIPSLVAPAAAPDSAAPLSAAPAAAAPAAALPVPAAASADKPLQTALDAAGEKAAAAVAPEKGADDAKAEAGLTFDLSKLRDGSDASVAGSERVELTSQLKKGENNKKGTPDRYDEDGNPDDGKGPLDDLGNPSRRGGEGGPDDTTDPDGGRRGGSDGLFSGPAKRGLSAVGIAGGLAAMGGFDVGSLMILPLIAMALILHEIGHAKVAAWYGDYTATLQNRASFNPKHWLNHVDPMMTLVLPLVTYFFSPFIFGGAKPVPVNVYNFRNPVKDMAVVALAGPAVNFILAAAGALAVTGATAAGLPVIASALVTFTFLNAVLGVFNLIPIHPLDGSHILRALLPQSLSQPLDRLYKKIGDVGGLAIVMGIAFFGSGFIVGAALTVTNLLVGGALAVTGLQVAGAWAATAIALGAALGQIRSSSVPAAPNDAPIAGDGSAAVDLIVVFNAGSLQGVTRDLHLSWVDLNQPNGVGMYEQAQQAMFAQIQAAGGIDAGALAGMSATPIATYRRINAATVRLDALRAAEFERAMRERGHSVYPNTRRSIVRPVPNEPEKMDPTARGAVTLEEALTLTKTDKVQAIARARWGAPDMGGIRGFLRRLTGETPVQPKAAVIDTGVALQHPMLRRVKESKNATAGDNVDDDGHGTWVHGDVLAHSPWAKNTTHYKTFLKGSATLDDILKALTMAGNDGNLVMSNSWGSDDGDSTSPDSVMVRKLAEEGHIMVFAAGNAGPRANTIGSPAIVHHRDAKTGAQRVLAVAATDRNKKVAYFSSRGPGSRKTQTIPDYPKRPDLSAVGYNTESSWPSELGPDRVDPTHGPVKAISGTSMSTPSVAGGILMLLMLFGVTTKGPQADAIVNAVMSTLEKTGQGHANEGDGFMNLEAAYEKLVPSRDAITEWNRLSLQSSAMVSRASSLERGDAPLSLQRTAAGGMRSTEEAFAVLAERYPLLTADPARADAMRRELDAYEYKRLSAEIARLRGSREAALAQGRAHNRGIGSMGDELLVFNETEIEPQLYAAIARRRAIREANPRVVYDASSPLRRWWLRVTGRGPSA